MYARLRVVLCICIDKLSCIIQDYNYMNAPAWGENIEDVGHNRLNPTNDHEGLLACYGDL